LTFEEGNDGLSPNVCTELPTYPPDIHEERETTPKIQWGNSEILYKTPKTTQIYKHRHRTWEHAKAKALVNYIASLNYKNESL